MPPVRAYQNFLTPLLHRRFSRASVTLLAICYVEAVLLGQWDSLFWSWFPFAPLLLIRIGILFICSFSIFVLRVAQLHVGLRTTVSGFDTFRQYAFRYQTIHTASWYLFSAWLYSEVYIYSAPKNANIKWITDAKSGERLRLNERPIYLMSYFIILALVQTGVHLWYDYDRISMPELKIERGVPSEQAKSLVERPSVQMKAKLPGIAMGAVQRALLMTCIAPFIYTMIIRQSAWSWSLMFAKMIWNLPKSTAMPAITPFHVHILWRTFTGGIMLIMMWEIANTAFTINVAQEPLKNERPITFESRDPNGSLLLGLKAKRLQTRVFAFWELVYIAQKYQGRRKTLFEDIDRAGGSSWSQISVLCLDMVNGINTRILEVTNPAPAATAPSNKITDAGLPRLTRGLNAENVLRPAPPPKTTSGTIAEAVGHVAKLHGQTPSSPLARGRELYEKTKSAVLTPEQEKALSPQGIWAFVREYALQGLLTPLGWPFREEFRRRINLVVLGHPYGDVGIIVDSIDSLVRLSVCSLKEDPYGNVQRDVPTIIRTFTSVILKLSSFVEKFGVHWTDVHKERNSREVDAILEALREGLDELLTAFGDYAGDLGLDHEDLKHARNAAAKEPKVNKEVNKEKRKEMEQAPRRPVK